MAKRRSTAKRGKQSPRSAKLKKSAADFAQATPGAQITQLQNPALLAQIRREVRNAVRTSAPSIISSLRNSDWLGPQQPVAPVAPDDAVDIRGWNYPSGYNVNITPRKYTPYSAQQLQWLADNFDLLREVIENRKNDLAKLEWDIVARQGEPLNDAISDAIKDQLRYPDGVHTYTTWQRMLLEEMYVIDGATIYPQLLRNGLPYRFHVVSGATILPLIDERGAPPDPPDPAYQQIINGLPYNNFTRDELIYVPRNLRPWSPVYGLSNVEQLMVTIAIGMKIESAYLMYYTKGSIPDVMIGVPPNWTPQQTGRFQAYFDHTFSGNLTRRAGGIVFVPGEMKEIAMKDYKFDEKQWEWLAKVVCACFHVSPQPYLSLINRATAETAHVQEVEEALEPEKDWWKGVMDRVLLYFGHPELEFHWKESDDLDPVEKATSEQLQLHNGTASINEVRALHGDDPIPGGEKFYVIAGNTPYEVTADGLTSAAPQTVPTGIGPDGKPTQSANGKPSANGNGKKPSGPSAAPNGKKPAAAAKSALTGRRYFERDGHLIPMDVL